MRQYSIFHAFVMPFFSKSFYQDVAKQWRGVCFLFLFLVLALTWVVAISVFHGQVGAFVQNEAPRLVEQLPTISIINGEAAIDLPQPYVITDPSTGKEFAIIDTTGQVTSLENLEAQVLLTKTQLHYERNAIESRTFELAQIENFTLDKALVNEWLGIVQQGAAPIAYPFALFGSYFYRILQVLIYAVIGMIIASMSGAQLSYGALVRLSVMAVVPVLILDTVRGAFGVTIPAWSFFCFVIAMVYLAFGVLANRPATDFQKTSVAFSMQ